MFDRMAALLARLLPPEHFLRGAALQQRVDLLRLFLLAKANQTWPEVNVRTLEQVRSMAPTTRMMRSAVDEHVEGCARAHLEGWRKERPPPLDPLDPEKPLADDRRLKVEEEYATKLHEAQKRAFGFALRVAPSGAAPSAGNGVYLDGSVPPGAVVAFYPGVWYEPFDMFSLPGGIEYFKVRCGLKPSCGRSSALVP